MNIGSIKGFVKCPWLLLSATVRKDMISDILRICNVKHEDINIIWKSPERANIYLDFISHVPDDISGNFRSLLREINQDGIHCSNTIISAPSKKIGYKVFRDLILKIDTKS